MGLFDLIDGFLIIRGNPDGIAVHRTGESPPFDVAPGSRFADVVDSDHNPHGPVGKVLSVFLRELGGRPAGPEHGMGVIVPDTFPTRGAADGLLDPLTPLPVDVDLSILSIGRLIRDRVLHEDSIRRAVAQKDAKTFPSVYLDGGDKQPDEGVLT